MKNSYPLLVFRLVLLFIVIQGCNTSDEDAVIPIIETEADQVILNQNSDVEIYIFDNDRNIPINGSLTLSSPNLGVVEMKDNNTPNDLSDDFLVYEALPNAVGEDNFEYTICNNNNDCSTQQVTTTITSLSIVSIFEGNTPHETLSSYNFFQGDLKDLNPTFGVIPYDLISPLFSDYAKKKRFIWMPNGVSANYIDDISPLRFPEGTFLIKNFYYNNVQPNNTTRLLETRLMYKNESGWDFANYIWNDEQTDAFFSNQGSFVDISWLENETIKSTNYRIPSRAECFTCHNQLDNPTPIGLKPQNLNKDYNYENGQNNQLRQLFEVGYLEEIPSNITTMVAWDDETQSLNDRVRSYLDINCAHCHSDDGHCNYRPMRFAYNLTTNDSNIGVCVEPETQFIPDSYIVKPNDTELSILHFRLNTTDESFRMPLLGRTINHDEGIELIEQWIISLTDCE